MREKSTEMFEELKEMGISDKELLEYIVFNWMTSDDAYESLKDFKECELGMM